MKALGVIVETTQKQGQLQMLPGCAVTEVFVTGQPKTIQLQIRSEAQDGVTPVVIFESRPHEYAEKVDFTLTVPVQWEQTRGQWVPKTRQRGVDNADVILMDLGDLKLHFRDIQVALITRGARFFITAQRVFQGWIRVIDGEIRFIPSLAEHSYPGMDYAQTWKGMGEVLAVMGRMVDNTVAALGAALDTPEAVQWKAAVLSNLNTWERGTVLFFNPITNSGRIRGISGVEYFVGPNALNEVQGPVKLLAPMAGVYFRLGQPQEDQRYLSVKAVRTA